MTFSPYVHLPSEKLLEAARVYGDEYPGLRHPHWHYTLALVRFGRRDEDRPLTPEDWLGVYLHMRRVFPEQSYTTTVSPYLLDAAEAHGDRYPDLRVLKWRWYLSHIYPTRLDDCDAWAQVYLTVRQRVSMDEVLDPDAPVEPATRPSPLAYPKSRSAR